MKPQKINIEIAERRYQIDVDSPKEEELKRKAAAEVNRRLDMRLKMNMAGVDVVDHLSLIAVELGVKYFSVQEKLVTGRLESERLHRDIESYLENIDK